MKPETKARWIVFDIETMPLSEKRLKELCPEFDPAEIKLGNLKDEAKIMERIEMARHSHFEDFTKKAALSAQTGRVVLITYATSLDEGSSVGLINDTDEKELLKKWWLLANTHFGANLIGFCSRRFDIPFLMRRSWINGLQHPCGEGTKHLLDRVIDLQWDWLMGIRDSEAGAQNLNAICKALGIGEKTGTGKDFLELWEKDRVKAIEYAVQDCRLTTGLARAMGVI